jgi:hypothetical protein
VLAAVLGGTSQLVAQERGTFEIGAFPTIAYFDRTLHLNQATAGPGLRLGYFLTDHIAIEADGMGSISPFTSYVSRLST